MDDQARDERIALNESLFREINDRVRDDIARLSHAPAEIEFVCECGRLDCRDQITLTPAEYESVRSDADLFAVAPGHEIPEAEDVVQHAARYSVVRKHPNVTDVVEATDPRGGGERSG